MSIKQIAYLECPTGISGDMCLGALVDVGVPLDYLKEKLSRLGLDAEHLLWSEKVYRGQQIVTKVHVDLLEITQHHRHLPEIEKLIEEATLPPGVTEWSLAIFGQLAIAEGAVHGIPPEKVHFHEVGATDAIIDIVGTCLGLDWLNIEELYCSQLPTGGGVVKAAHGTLSVPTPAVLKLWESRNVPVYSNGIEKELVTPTGAAIAVTLAKSFCSVPTMRLEKIGLGAGSQELVLPNVLRLWLGQVDEKKKSDTVSVLETQIDDLNPQAIGYLYSVLFQAEALDVFTTAVMMKKSRPGLLLTVICLPEQVEELSRIIFKETTTLGIRYLTQEREILEREIKIVETVYGSVRVKIARYEGEVINIQPEYEDCAKLAKQHQQPWRVIHQMVLNNLPQF